jgi:hypothetical protein
VFIGVPSRSRTSADDVPVVIPTADVGAGTPIPRAGPRWIVRPEEAERCVEPQPAATVAAQHAKRTAASFITRYTSPGPLFVTGPSRDIPEHWGRRAFRNVGLRFQKSVAGCLLARSPVGLLLPKVESGLFSQVAATPAPHCVEGYRLLCSSDIPEY